MFAEDSFLVERRGLHDEDVADGVLDDLTRYRSQALPFARAEPTVTHDDDVRRIRTDGVEQCLRRITADDPLVDVSLPVLGQAGDRLLQSLTGGLDAVDVAVHAFG